ncbi:MAG: tRNA (N6-threonylcarbamoyladenosine(37)-N6)-methyltransferase TrmO [Methanomicrobiales archaeon]|nr:tRNA (N6-threonylcarbamoyladenosine(37)-N6)-methyltransferase TrmO [Methanomicrobiales archaeon]
MSDGREFLIRPIGVIRSPYTKTGQAPRQGRERPDVEAEIDIFPTFRDGLGDFSGISHIIILFWFDRANRDTLIARPPGAQENRPVFMTRSPNRPNPVGFDVAEIIAVEGARIRVTGCDALDGTPVIDIKPYVPSLDCIPGASDPRAAGRGREPRRA